MSNNNSYVENIKNLSKSVTDVMDVVNAVDKSITGNQEYVVLDSSTKLISNTYIQKRLERVENTVAKFTQGNGIVETDDGTYRKIKVDSVPKPPANITTLKNVSTFGIDPNWFFENLQYPKCIIRVDLKDLIDDDSDRVYVNRIIIDSQQNRLTSDVKNTILSSQFSYGDMITYLNNNMIGYKEDKDEVKLPLTYEKYHGRFQVIGTTMERDYETGLNNLWYYLSTVNYSKVDEDGNLLDSGNILSVGDYLRFNNSLFKVKGVVQEEKRVRLEYSVGYETIGMYDFLEFYNEPFSEKTINVGIGIDEINVIYIKGVNENYNLLAREWSNPIAFVSNDLIFENDDTVSFETYYRNNVADFGKQWVAQIKEGRISSIEGLKPNAPVLNADDLEVVQINTQLNVTIDSKKYNDLVSKITSTKSNISSIRTTISSNKNKLISENNPDMRDNIQKAVNDDTQKLSTLTTQFSSNVEDLNTMLTDAGAIEYDPKYHIRGFFQIPEPRYAFDNGIIKAGKQSIIGFETMYRYLHTDKTGVKLNKFNYTDTRTGVQASGTFSDWNLSVSRFLEKTYNVDEDIYEWTEESMDGTSIVINQIDIPIRNGEKVEIKVRSISEAGYPYNPMKSDWSNSIIISFPENLSTTDSVSKILESVKSDMNSVVLQETLTSAGVYTHMSDMNSQYKHSAQFIEYIDTSTNTNGKVLSTTTMPLSEKIKSMMDILYKIMDRVGLVFDNNGNIQVNSTTVIDTSTNSAVTVDTSTNVSVDTQSNALSTTDTSTNSNSNSEVESTDQEDSSPNDE